MASRGVTSIGGVGGSVIVAVLALCGAMGCGCRDGGDSDATEAGAAQSASAAATPAAREMMAAAAETEFGGGLCVETVVVARQAGYDYEKIVAGCLAGRVDAMRSLFWLSKHAGFDAASGQGNAAVSGMLLRKLGDAFYGKCLAAQGPAVRASVRMDLLYDLGYGNAEITLATIVAQYPTTFAPPRHPYRDLEAVREFVVERDDDPVVPKGMVWAISGHDVAEGRVCTSDVLLNGRAAIGGFELEGKYWLTFQSPQEQTIWAYEDASIGLGDTRGELFVTEFRDNTPE